MRSNQVDGIPAAGAITDAYHRAAMCGPWPAELDDVLPLEAMAAAHTEIARWLGYAPTPLVALDRLAADLGLATLHYKDESGRFGLGSFKSLGGAYAVMMLLADLIEARNGVRPALDAIRNGSLADAARAVTVVTATDGNHGRSVAWGARMAGCRCRIYVHAGVSPARTAAMEALGAEVVRVAGDYDDSLHRCAGDAAEMGWHVVSDTSYDGYMALPRHVMAGYSVMAAEILEAMGAAPPTHVVVQAGVGGLAAAVCARMWSALDADRPVFVIVEPDRAACVLESARQNRPMTVGIARETVMAGLSCGEVSLLAWEILSRGAGHFLAIGEDGIGPAMRLLASGTAGGGCIEAGESAVPGLVALLAVCADPSLRETVGVGTDSRVVLLGTEGATDPDIYRAMIAAPEPAHG